MTIIRTIDNNNLTHSGIIENPVCLLLITGILIGFNFPLGKIAVNAGISPLVWAMVISFGASAFTLPILVTKRRLILPRGKLLVYVVFSSLITYVIPNFILYNILPYTGSGYTGLMYALSPVFTLTMAMLLRIHRPTYMGALGIIIGMIGAFTVSISYGLAPKSPSLFWIAAALLIPLFLAFGNIYRTIYWPDKALPDLLAFWSHVFSVIVFMFLLLLTKGTVPLNELSYSPSIVAAQMLVAGLTYPVFFRLQQKGGPVLLSQIGYIAAAVSIIIATILLKEQYTIMTWGGATIIAVGIAVTIKAQIKKT